MPTLCQECAQPFTSHPGYSARKSLFDKLFSGTIDKIKVRGRQCKRCRNTGIAGRTVAAEVIWVDEPSREYIQKGDMLGWEKYLRTRGWRSFSEHAIDIAKQGLCDPLDIEKVIGSYEVSINREYQYNI